MYDPIKFPEGTKVRIADLTILEDFYQSWKFHDPLTPEQLAYAGQFAVVEKTGIYHGGDVIYKLLNISGVWHQSCLIACK